jgi:hypothetical protein
LRQYQRKLKDDCARIETAQSALKEQHLIDCVLNNERIAARLKTFVIEASEVIPSQKIAYKLADCTGVSADKQQERVPYYRP